MVFCPLPKKDSAIDGGRASVESAVAELSVNSCQLHLQQLEDGSESERTLDMGRMCIDIRRHYSLTCGRLLVEKG